MRSGSCEYSVPLNISSPIALRRFDSRLYWSGGFRFYGSGGGDDGATGEGSVLGVEEVMGSTTSATVEESQARSGSAEPTTDPVFFLERAAMSSGQRIREGGWRK